MSKQFYTLTLNSRLSALYKQAPRHPVWPGRELVLVSVFKHLGPCFYCPKIFKRHLLNDTVFDITYRSDSSALANVSYFTENMGTEFEIIAMRNNMHRYAHSRISLIMCVHTFLGHQTALWVHHLSLVDTQILIFPSFHASVLFHL